MNITVLRKRFEILWTREFDDSGEDLKMFDREVQGNYIKHGMQAAWLIFKATTEYHDNLHQVGANGLKRCPYCGADGERYPDGDMEGYSVMCSGQHALFGATYKECPSGTFGYASQEDADTAWNTRASL